MQPPTNDNLNLTQLDEYNKQDGLENNPLPTKKEIREVLDKMDEDNLRNWNSYYSK
jgi:hypothetical protein